jgi:hypothetical protein
MSGERAFDWSTQESTSKEDYDQREKRQYNRRSTSVSSARKRQHANQRSQNNRINRYNRYNRSNRTNRKYDTDRSFEHKSRQNVFYHTK